mgnify:CR=1 FL=1
MEKNLNKLIALIEQKLEWVRLTGEMYVEVSVIANKFKELKKWKKITKPMVEKLNEMKEILKNFEDDNLDKKIVDCVKLYVKKGLLFPYGGIFQIFAYGDFYGDELPYLIFTPKPINLKEGEILLCRDVDENKSILYIAKNGKERKIKMPYLAMYIDSERKLTAEKALEHINTVGLIMALK